MCMNNHQIRCGIQPRIWIRIWGEQYGSLTSHMGMNHDQLAEYLSDPVFILDNHESVNRGAN